MITCFFTFAQLCSLNSLEIDAILNTWEWERYRFTIEHVQRQV